MTFIERLLVITLVGILFASSFLALKDARAQYYNTVQGPWTCAQGSSGTRLAYEAMAIKGNQLCYAYGLQPVEQQPYCAPACGALMYPLQIGQGCGRGCPSTSPACGLGASDKQMYWARGVVRCR